MNKTPDFYPQKRFRGSIWRPSAHEKTTLHISKSDRIFGESCTDYKYNFIKSAFRRGKTQTCRSYKLIGELYSNPNDIFSFGATNYLNKVSQILRVFDDTVRRWCRKRSSKKYYISFIINENIKIKMSPNLSH